jgi:hypothetical protein
VALESCGKYAGFLEQERDNLNEQRSTLEGITKEQASQIAHYRESENQEILYFLSGIVCGFVLGAVVAK